jgi:hypothetical protein
MGRRVGENKLPRLKAADDAQPPTGSGTMFALCSEDVKNKAGTSRAQ